MKILFRHIFKQFFVATISLSALIIGVLWLAQSLRYMDFIINNNISVGSFFSLVFYLLPDLFVNICPIAFAVATLFCFHKLLINHELSALRALGLSNIRLSYPVVSLSAGLCLLLFLLNLVVVPVSFYKFREQQHIIQSSFSGMYLREGSFNTTKRFTIYVREHNAEDVLKGVFIYQPPNSESPKNTQISFTTLAEEGRVIRQNDKLLIHLKKGQRQEYNPLTGTFSLFSFDEFIYDLTDEISNTKIRSEKPFEKSLKQLLYPESKLSNEMKRRYAVEGHQRILLPFLCILDALIICGCLLFGEISRRFDRRKFILLIFSIFSIHIVLMGLIHSSINYPFCILLAYCHVFGGILFGIPFLSRDMIQFYLKRNNKAKNL